MAASDLAVYLRDHFADACAATRLASRISQDCRATPKAAVFAELATDIGRDRDVLLRLLVRFDGRRASRQSGLGRIGTLAETVPLEADGASRSDGELVGALETLSIAVDSKAAMWMTLGRVRADYRALATLDLERLIVRAARQSRILRREQIDAAIRAFGSSETPADATADGVESRALNTRAPGEERDGSAARLHP